MRSVRLLALDLDGTLLDAAGRLSPAHRSAVRAARAQGIEVVLATGRSWRGCQDVYRTLDLTLPAITYLGAQVVDGSGQVLWANPLPPAAVAAAWDVARRAGASLVACLGPGRAVGNVQAADFGPWAVWNPFTEIVGDLTPHLAAAAPLMLVVYGAAGVAALRAAFPTGLPGCTSDVWDGRPEEALIHFWRQGVDKSVALARLCRQLGFRPAEVLAMGDGLADLEMLRWAGTAVAMAAAPAAVRAVADAVADAQDPHPVATALQRLGILTA